jgi:hypothetical protein
LIAGIFVIVLLVLFSNWATYDIALSFPKIRGMVLGTGIIIAAAREEFR